MVRALRTIAPARARCPGGGRRGRANAGILGRVVGAEVRAAALGARERALGDQPGSRCGAVAQALEPGAVADEAGVLPERRGGASGVTALGLVRLRHRRRAEPSGQLGLAEGGESGAAAEDEALEQGVRRQPVRAVHAGAGALAGGVQAGQLGAARRGR